MAKKSRAGSVNKSQAIRDFSEANPDAGPSAVVEALKGQGVEVSAQFVSTILSNARRKSGKRKRRGRRRAEEGAAATAGASTAAATGRVSTDSLMAAKRFVSQMGGVQKAKAAVDLLAKLLD